MVGENFDPETGYRKPGRGFVGGVPYDEWLKGIQDEIKGMGVRKDLEREVGWDVVEEAGRDVGVSRERLLSRERGKGGRVRTVHLSDEAYEGLRRWAESYGLVRGGHGNVSALLELLGMNKLEVVEPGGAGRAF